MEMVALAFFPALATAVTSYGLYRTATGKCISKAYRWAERGLYIVLGLELLVILAVWL